jgi:hypothetical protein
MSSSRKYPHKWSNMVQSRRGSGTLIDVKLGWKEDWRTVYYALLWSAIGIIVRFHTSPYDTTPANDQIRCVFRVAEFSQGYDGPLRTIEFWFYVLDTLPLVLGIAVWTFVWPPKILGEQRDFAGVNGGGLTAGHEMDRVDTAFKGSSDTGLMYQRV